MVACWTSSPVPPPPLLCSPHLAVAKGIWTAVRNRYRICELVSRLGCVLGGTGRADTADAREQRRRRQDGQHSLGGRRRRGRAS
eukprot:2154756-Rhodomonas_salina.2